MSYNVETQNREEDWKNDFWTCDTSKEKGRKSSSVVTKRRYPDGIGILRISFSSAKPDTGTLKYFEFEIFQFLIVETDTKEIYYQTRRRFEKKWKSIFQIEDGKKCLDNKG